MSIMNRDRTPLPPDAGYSPVAQLDSPSSNSVRNREARDLGFSVELRRIELLTSSMPWKRSTN